MFEQRGRNHKMNRLREAAQIITKSMAQTYELNRVQNCLPFFVKHITKTPAF